MVWKSTLTPEQLERFGREREKKAYQDYIGKHRQEENDEACRTGISPFRKSWACALTSLWAEVK